MSAQFFFFFLTPPPSTPVHANTNNYFGNSEQWTYDTAPLIHTCRHTNIETYAYTHVYLNSVLNSIDIQAE